MGKGIKELKKYQGELFSPTDVMALVGISRRRLLYWIEIKLIRPFITKKVRRRTFYRFSFDDLLFVRHVKSLLDSGLNLSQIRKIKVSLREIDDDGKFDEGFIFLKNGKAEFVGIDNFGHERAVDLLKGEYLLFPMARFDGLVEKLEKIEAEGREVEEIVV